MRDNGWVSGGPTTDAVTWAGGELVVVVADAAVEDVCSPAVDVTDPWSEGAEVWGARRESLCAHPAAATTRTATTSLTGRRRRRWGGADTAGSVALPEVNQGSVRLRRQTGC